MNLRRSRISTPMLVRLRNLPAYLIDPEIPLLRRGALVLAVLYILSPVDAIPDVVPVVGWLDDIGVMGMLVGALMRGLDGYVPPSQRELAE
jgi:uncharacterized membrane protein YkvA (DUF1232 family)